MLAFYIRGIKWLLVTFIVTIVIGKGEGGHIEGAQIASVGEYPYFVYFGGDVHCAGVLITREEILVSAHCFYVGNDVVTLKRVRAIVGVVRLADSTGQEIGALAFRPHINFTHTGEGKTLVTDYDMALITLLGLFEESATVKVAGFDGFTPSTLHEAFLKVVESKKRCVTIGYGTSSRRFIKNMIVLRMEVLPQDGCKVPAEVKDSVICCKPESNAIHFGHSGSPLICGGTVFGLFKVYYNYTLDGKEIVAYTYTAVWPFINYFETELGKKITGGTMNISPVFICQLLAIAFAVVRTLLT